MKIFKKILKAIQEPAPEPVKEQTMANTASVTPVRRRNNVEINIEVPEELVQQAAIAIGIPSHFSQKLLLGEVFRAANLTPIYFTNQSQTELRVMAREFIENPRLLN